MINRTGMWLLMVLAWFSFSSFAEGAQQNHAVLDRNTARLHNGRVGVVFDLVHGTYDLNDAESGQPVVRGAHAEVAQWTTDDAACTRTASTNAISDELGKGRCLLVECTATGKPSILIEFRVYDGASFVVLRGC
jgi:hypothetical protein